MAPRELAPPFYFFLEKKRKGLRVIHSHEHCILQLIKDINSPNEMPASSKKSPSKQGGEDAIYTHAEYNDVLKGKGEDEISLSLYEKLVKLGDEDLMKPVEQDPHDAEHPKKKGWFVDRCKETGEILKKADGTLWWIREPVEDDKRAGKGQRPAGHPDRKSGRSGAPATWYKQQSNNFPDVANPAETIPAVGSEMTDAKFDAMVDKMNENFKSEMKKMNENIAGVLVTMKSHFGKTLKDINAKLDLAINLNEMTEDDDKYLELQKKLNAQKERCVELEKRLAEKNDGGWANKRAAEGSASGEADSKKVKVEGEVNPVD